MRTDIPKLTMAVENGALRIAVEEIRMHALREFRDTYLRVNSEEYEVATACIEDIEREIKRHED